MSTRGTLFYKTYRLQVHIYHECINNWVYVELQNGRGKVLIDIPIFPYCWLGKMRRD